MFENIAFSNVQGNTTYDDDTDYRKNDDDIMSLPQAKVIYIFLYSIIFMLGNTGNALVVYVVLRNKSMQTITNVFITNLAISDIMMCILAVPFTPLAYFMGAWKFGDALCHIVPFIMCVSVYVSTLTSTAIAIDRYFVIVFPFKPRMKMFVCLTLIIAIWVISISISLPLGIYQKVDFLPEHNATFCREDWPRPQSRQFFTVTSLVLQYIVPCIIITFCYSNVSLVLRHRARTQIGSGSRSREREEMEIRRKRRTNKMLIAMVAIFMCCWLPLNIVLLVVDYKPGMNNWPYHKLLFFTAHLIAMSSTVYNPFLYAWMNDNFKKEFKAIMPCLFSRQPDSGADGNYTVYTNADTTKYGEKNGAKSTEIPMKTMGNDTTQTATHLTTVDDADCDSTF